MKSTQAQPFKIMELVRSSWRALLASPGLLVGTTALYVAFIIKYPGFNSGLAQYHSLGFIALVAILSLIVTGALSIFLLAGLIKIFLMHHDGLKPSGAELFRHRRLFWKFIFTEVMVALIVMIGFVFFVIPGIIFAIKLNFAGYISIDKELGPSESIKESWRITRGRKWLVLKMILATALINIIAAFANIGGLLVSLSLTLMIQVSAYRALEKDPQNQKAFAIQ